ncbi:hypothetical protein, partial [Enterobacter hormaechei]|uniref:hypothetical protein n=1 Tax=Enterobacter hormaechei TaxID=158836 RepID=UPI001ED9A9AF
VSQRVRLEVEVFMAVSCKINYGNSLRKTINKTFIALGKNGMKCRREGMKCLGSGMNDLAGE